MTPPPQTLLSLSLSLNWVLNCLERASRSARSSFLTSVTGTQVAVFMWQSFPRLALPLMKQKETPFFLQRAGRKNHLDGVDVVGDDDELGLVLFDEGGDVVKAELKVAWLGGLSGSGLSLLLQSLLLVLSGLWGVFTEKLKDFASLVLVNSVGELVDGGGDL